METTPGRKPIDFKKDLKTPGQLIHKGIFSPDLNEFYYTLSDEAFKKFDVFVIRKLDNSWTEARQAFFNSPYNEHGMCFSPNGDTLYFSSTRPINAQDTSQTWHIWRSVKQNSAWSAPSFVDIPNMSHKMTSHPSVTSSGIMYFHASNTDYSEIDLYFTKMGNGKYKEAQKVSMPGSFPGGKCTPFISPGHDYLIFASISEKLDLWLSFNKEGHWSQPVKFGEAINSSNQGNPFVTPDDRYLFYTSGRLSDTDWSIKWVDISTQLEITNP